MTFLTRMANKISPEEALRQRWAQVQANIAYDQRIIERMQKHSDLRKGAQKARLRRMHERLQVELYKRDEISKIASMCEVRLRS